MTIAKSVTASIICLLLVGCGDERAQVDDATLQVRLATTTTANHELFHQVLARMTARLDSAAAAGRPPQINVLLLSGGAEWGAFGAGFLHAWSEIPAGDAKAMPEFDLVTGISTGALITPYVLLGTKDALVRIDDLYRQSKPAYAERQLFGFLGSKTGLYDISELEKVIRGDLEATIVPGLAKLVDRNRTGVIASCDMDLGVLRLWDVAKEAGTSAERLFIVERAAIAIPAAFDPVLIDGGLHADAGTLMQFIALAEPEVLAETLKTWNAAHPQTPARIRQWVIINNKPHEPLITVQPTWTDGLSRSMSLMVKAGVIGPLTSLTLQAELLRRQGLDVELRWISIPADLRIDLSLPPFDNKTTVPLSDLGRKLGATQTGWQTAPPRFSGRRLDGLEIELDQSGP